MPLIWHEPFSVGESREVLKHFRLHPVSCEWCTTHFLCGYPPEKHTQCTCFSELLNVVWTRYLSYERLPLLSPLLYNPHVLIAGTDVSIVCTRFILYFLVSNAGSLVRTSSFSNKWSAGGITLRRKELMNDTPTSQEQPNETAAPPPTPQELLKESVRAECGALLGSDTQSAFTLECGDVVVHVAKENLVSLLKVLRDSQLQFTMLLDITAVDWMDQREARFELVYQLLSIPTTKRITVKVALQENSPEIESVVPLFRSANFLEREVWDMFGIKFKGHPDLRRILMYEEFKGHPLRKDYPVQGKQPRVPLRKPEVENTARQMKRGDLVAIRSKKSSDTAAHNG